MNVLRRHPLVRADLARPLTATRISRQVWVRSSRGIFSLITGSNHKTRNFTRFVSPTCGA